MASGGGGAKDLARCRARRRGAPRNSVYGAFQFAVQHRAHERQPGCSYVEAMKMWLVVDERGLGVEFAVRVLHGQLLHTYLCSTAPSDVAPMPESVLVLYMGILPRWYVAS